MKLIAVGRTFFAVALVGLGLEHYLFGDFITGRAPAWPKAVPGRLVWAYATGAFFVGTGAALLSGKWARPAAVSAAALIFIWALLRQIPVLATDPLLSGAWTQAGKALTFFGGLLAMAATFPRTTVGPNLLQSVVNGRREYIVAARVCLGTFFVITGIQHFMYTEFVASLIPAWFPGDAVFWTYFAGVALIAGGIGLFIARTAQLAAFLSGLMVFSWFWLVHLPRTFTSRSDGISIFEALAVSGIAFVVAGFLHERQRARAVVG